MAEIYRPDTPRNRGDSDAPHLSPVTPAEDARTILINKISWGAVLAGVVVALVAQLILNMIGIGIGASTLDPGGGAADNPTATGFSIGAAIWWTLSGVLAALAGGYAAGRLAGKPKELTASWHGLTAWALTTLIVFYLLTSTLGSVIGGAYRTVTNAAGNIASTAGGAVQTAAQAAAPSLASGVNDPFASIEQSLRGVTGGNDPAALRDAAIASVRAALTGNPQQAQEARERSRPGDLPRSEHSDRTGQNPRSAVRAAIPTVSRYGQAAGNRGGRSRCDGSLARSPVRIARPSSWRRRRMVGRSHGRRRADHRDTSSSHQSDSSRAGHNRRRRKRW